MSPDVFVTYLPGRSPTPLAVSNSEMSFCDHARIFRSASASASHIWRTLLALSRSLDLMRFNTLHSNFTAVQFGGVARNRRFARGYASSVWPKCPYELTSIERALKSFGLEDKTRLAKSIAVFHSCRL